MLSTQQACNKIDKIVYLTRLSIKRLQTLSDFNAVMHCKTIQLLNALMTAHLQLQVSNGSSNDSGFGIIKSPVRNIIVNFT